jgi:hypothetical protein
MLETELDKAIRAYVLSKRGLIYKLSPSGLTDKGLPDHIGGIFGIPFAVEAKIHPNKPTPIQLATLSRFELQGYRVGVVYSLQDFKDLFNAKD